MKLYLILLMCLIDYSFCYSQESKQDCLNLFSQTINNISRTRSEPGIRDEVLAGNVLEIINNNDDSLISLEKKIDIIILINVFEDYAYRVLCNKVSILCKNDTLFKRSNLLLLLLFTDCEFTNYPEFVDLDTVIVMYQLTKLSESYRFFFTKLVRERSTKPNDQKISYYYFLDTLLDSKFKKKYPNLFR